jgi:hypothetical protein
MKNFSEFCCLCNFGGNFRFMYIKCCWLKANENLTQISLSYLQYCHIISYLTTYKGSSYIFIYIYVCSQFLNPLTRLYKVRFYLYLYTTAKDFQCK